MKKNNSNSWMQTYTGINFYPTKPKIEDIKIIDIAHSLSLICRFNGHCLYFYSVAEHSVRASYIPKKTNLQLTALLHDASEAYVGDLIRPIKEFTHEFKKIENNIQKIISKKFNLPYPFPKEIKEADNIMLATERRDILLPTKDAWCIDKYKPLKKTIQPWSYKKANLMFLQRFNELMN
jgi:5'-deoxynucleotidase YfbR-like HD superfamily hydrolase